ncbi:hypothetical protein D9M68_871900 [compost metagenome]
MAGLKSKSTAKSLAEVKVAVTSCTSPMSPSAPAGPGGPEGPSHDKRKNGVVRRAKNSFFITKWSLYQYDHTLKGLKILLLR